MSPLQKLIEYADLSDDHQYGTLSSDLVRDLANEAIALNAELLEALRDCVQAIVGEHWMHGGDNWPEVVAARGILARATKETQ